MKNQKRNMDDDINALLDKLNAEGEASDVALKDFLSQVGQVRKQLIVEGYSEQLATTMGHQFFMKRMGILQDAPEGDEDEDDDD